MNTENRVEEVTREIKELERFKASLSQEDRFKLHGLKKELKKLLGEETDSVETAISSVFVGDDEVQGNTIQKILISQIEFPEYKDRSGIEDKKVGELAQSIKENGLLQPVVLTKAGKNKYKKLVGRMRIEACKTLGMKKINAIIVEERGEKETLLKILHENIMRTDLSIYDKIRSLVTLVSYALECDFNEARKEITRADNFLKGNSQKEDASELSRRAKTIDTVIKESQLYNTISNVTKHLKVLNMEKHVLKHLNEDKISFRVALLMDVFASKVEEELFLKILDEVVLKGYGHRETEILIAEHTKPSVTPSVSPVRIEVQNKFKSFKNKLKTLDDNKLSLLLEELNALEKDFLT